jgi:formamidopyrimidine-DNA glycosylase
MPELPEVEVIRRGLAPRVAGRLFLDVVVGDKPLRRQSPPAELRRWLIGRRIVRLERRGKHLLFHLEGGPTLLIHLGMTGRLLLLPASASGFSLTENRKPKTENGINPPPSPALPHVHLQFRLDGGLILAFQDARRFGQVEVFPPGEVPAQLAQVGREPFSRSVTAQWLASQAEGRSRPIKKFLLDGRILAGIGNIYASEILFACGLHPGAPAGRLDETAWGQVLTETRRILREAIRQGGTSVSDYLNSRGEAGLFQLQLKVYGRAGEGCERCGAVIARLVQAGRSSFFCPACQKM